MSTTKTRMQRTAPGACPVKLACVLLTVLTSAISATGASAHLLAQSSNRQVLPQIVELAATAARQAIVPGPTVIQIFESGMLVSQDLITLDLATLDASAFGDTDEPSH